MEIAARRAGRECEVGAESRELIIALGLSPMARNAGGQQKKNRRTKLGDF